MTPSIARKIGSRQALVAVGIGVLIAQIIIASMISAGEGFIRSFFWFFDEKIWLNILSGVVIMFFCGHYYGQLAGKLILIKNWNYALIGCLTNLAILLTTAFLASWIGFFQEGIANISTDNNPFFDYIFKPVYWVMIFGSIPAMIVGIWLGKRIKTRGSRLN